MLASTVQFSNNTHNPNSLQHQPPPKGDAVWPQSGSCIFLPRKNTHVFSQDPTVCRYRHRRTVIEDSPIRDVWLSVFHPWAPAVPHVGTKRALPHHHLL